MKKSKEMCSGCYNNDYNHGLGGAKECWLFENAKIQKRLEIHINQSPPYDFSQAKETMSCYQRPQFAFVNEGALTSDGYWK